MNQSHQAKSKKIETIEPEDFFDVLIIGGGPHALGLAARLRESRPASLYTDLEHSKLSFLKSRKSTHSKKSYNQETKILALDSSSNQWLGRWNGFFEQLSIQHLRSPMFFHPSPSDVDALEAFARATDSEVDCETSAGIENLKPTVGQSNNGEDRKFKKSKNLLGSQINERERSSYARPSFKLFKRFCEDELIKRYQLSNMIREEKVIGLRYENLHVKTEGQGLGFLIETEKGMRYGARFVVMAIGGQETPSIPSCLKSNNQELHQSHHGPGWCHSLWFTEGGNRDFKQAVKLCATTSDSDEGDGGSIVVIGGGLTSAQIADLAIRKGARKVILICRGYLKTKHYDFPLSWVTKYANLEKMTFWQEDCRMARLKMVKQARNGGSVNPSTLLLLKKRVSEGRLEIYSHTSIQSASRDEKTSTWTLNLITQSTPSSIHQRTIEKTLKNVHFIVSATGGHLDFSKVSFLKPLMDELSSHSSIISNPPTIINGLPVLDESLRWGSQLPLFVMGAYAFLELGPDAANLGGSRTGAERIGSELDVLLQTDWSTSSFSPSPSSPPSSSSSTHHDLNIIDSSVTSSSSSGGSSSIVSSQERSKNLRKKSKMGARERRAGNLGSWFDGLEEVEA